MRQKIQQFTLETCYVFAFLMICCVPFPLYLFSFHSTFIHWLFKDFLAWIAQYILQWNLIENVDISSDSSLLYVLVFFLFFLSIFSTLALQFFAFWQKNKEQWLYFFRQVFAFYLAFQLINYGFDKVFKAQFYLPEPNTLYTPFGQMSKDLLFWSVMGTSYSYNLFMGLAEVLPGILLFFRKTRLLATLLAFGVMLNVWVINFSFDISVKIYASFLCFLSILLIGPYIAQLYRFFVLEKNISLKNEQRSFTFLQSPAWKAGLKTLLIGLIFLEILFPFLSAQNFQDDWAARPPLHGAYEVVSVKKEGKKILLSQSPIRRFFIHRKGFFIFQDRKDNFRDYKLHYDLQNKYLLLTDYQKNSQKLPYQFHPQKKLFILTYKNYQFKAKVLDWKKLPALQPDFHWRVDAF